MLHNIRRDFLSNMTYHIFGQNKKKYMELSIIKTYESKGLANAYLIEIKTGKRSTYYATHARKGVDPIAALEYRKRYEVKWRDEKYLIDCGKGLRTSRKRFDTIVESLSTGKVEIVEEVAV